MKKILNAKIREALSSVLPITAIVFFLSVTIVPMPVGTIFLFLTGAAMLILGMGFFSLGADTAMVPMGEGIGAALTKSKKIGVIALVSLLIGVLVTVAEPDLMVLANQVPSIPNPLLIWTVALGVGFFLTVAVLRIFFKISLSYIFAFSYLLVFILMFFVPKDFIAMAFDSGGVTTGAITVPFIMTLGIGISSIRGDKNSEEDSFGLTALCSIGPVLAVLLLGIYYTPTTADYTAIVIPDVTTTIDVAKQFLTGIASYSKEVLSALLPIVLFFAVFQLITKRFRKHDLIKIGVGLIYTFVGLVLFLAGVNIGFMSVGYYIGSEIASSAYMWVLVPLGILIGYFIVDAEPAVHVLNKQVEEVSRGAISQKSMRLGLSVGVAVSVALAMVRSLTGINMLWFLVPGYAIAIALAFITPKIFMSIAFDSGGIASGTMTATFLLPFAIGACESVGGNIMTDAFGVIAMVAMTPLISIQIMGLIYKRKMEVSETMSGKTPELEDIIINYEEDNCND